MIADIAEEMLTKDSCHSTLAGPLVCVEIWKREFFPIIITFYYSANSLLGCKNIRSFKNDCSDVVLDTILSCHYQKLLVRFF